MQRNQSVSVRLWHGKGDVRLQVADLVGVVRQAVRAASKNDLRLIEEAAKLELRRRVELDRVALVGLHESKRRKAERTAKHAANVKAAQERREARRMAYMGRKANDAEALDAWREANFRATEGFWRKRNTIEEIDTENMADEYIRRFG